MTRAQAVVADLTMKKHGEVSERCKRAVWIGN